MYGTDVPAGQYVPFGHSYPCCVVMFKGVEEVVPGPKAYPGVPKEQKSEIYNKNQIEGNGTQVVSANKNR